VVRAAGRQPAGALAKPIAAPRDGLRHDNPQIPGFGICPHSAGAARQPQPPADPRAGLHRYHPRQGAPRSLWRSRPAGTGCAEKDRALFGVGGAVGGVIDGGGEGIRCRLILNS